MVVDLRSVGSRIDGAPPRRTKRCSHARGARRREIAAERAVFRECSAKIERVGLERCPFDSRSFMLQADGLLQRAKVARLLPGLCCVIERRQLYRIKFGSAREHGT